LNSDMLVMYSKNNCMFCNKAAALLDSYGIPYESVKIDENQEARDFLVAQGHRAVPQFYLNDELFVGGGYQGISAMSKDEIELKIQLG
jgi:glutaredoxin